MSDLRVLVAGTVRNPSGELDRTVRVLAKRLRSLGVEYKFFVVESDSKPSKLRRLERLRSSLPNFDYVNLGELRTEIPNRIERISVCRNRYLVYLESVISETYTHLMVADFDGVNSWLSFPPDRESIFRDKDVVSATQSLRYYDIFALRRFNEGDEDYRHRISKMVSEGSSVADAFLACVWTPQIRMARLENEFSVESAFGGIAIYPVDTIKGARYETGESRIIECEHVFFSRELRRRGAQILVLPDLKNRGSVRHTGFSLIGPMMVRFLRLAPIDRLLRKHVSWLRVFGRDP